MVNTVIYDGDALPILVHAKDDELTGLGLSGHPRRFDLQQHQAGPERDLFDDSIHVTLPSIYNKC